MEKLENISAKLEKKYTEMNRITEGDERITKKIKNLRIKICKGDNCWKE